MKEKLYFEFKEPYYALIAASDQKDAKETYRCGVVEIEDECSWSLISESDAYDKFSAVIMEEVMASKRDYKGPNAIKREFNEIVNNQSGLLLVDGSLV